MKRRDLEKLRRLDPEMARQFEEQVLSKRGANASTEAPGEPPEASAGLPQCEGAERAALAAEEAEGASLAAHTVDAPLRPSQEAQDDAESPPPPSDQPDRAEDEDACGEPGRPGFAEGWQESLPLPPEAYEDGDGQRVLPGVAGSVAPEIEDESEAKESEVDALLAKLQTALPFEEETPDCKRSAEELSLLAWQDKSTRREDEVFELPAEYDAELRCMSDAELGEAWGWVTKRRYRGLSSRDQAVQREVYARSLGLLDLYGLARQPAVSARLEEVLRAQRCRSSVALYVVALLELMLVRRRLALRLSASDAHTLKGCAASTWWAAIGRLETLGILQRVRTSKPGEHGPAPVQRSTNLYVLGPWWFEGKKNRHGEPIPGTTPLEQGLGLLDKCTRKEDSPAAAAAMRETLRPRRARRRAVNTRNRDRNRLRHRALPPRVATTPDVARAADVLARARLAELEVAKEARDLRRAQALMSGDLTAVEHQEEPVTEVAPAESSERAEDAAVAQVARVNRGMPEGGDLRREVTRMRLRAPSPSSREEVNCRPEIGRQSRRGKPKEKFFLEPPPPSLRPAASQTQDPPPRTKAGDNSTRPTVNLRVRAQALDGGSSNDRFRQRDEPASLQDDPIIRQAFVATFGHSMPGDLDPPSTR